MRQDFYVYLHKDKLGNIFYVGKGTGKRAWEKSRHPAWLKYVEERLNGEYIVEIYKDKLSDDGALELEEQLILKHGETLVNWMNSKRGFDYEALAIYHKKRNANRLFVAETRPFEISEPQKAIQRYKEALNSMREYESLTLERGLVAELDVGPNWGDPGILDRLTICLIKEGLQEEAIHEAEKYFNEFPSCLNLTVGKRVKKRIDKLMVNSHLGDHRQ